jgi:hypothetical protein
MRPIVTGALHDLDPTSSAMIAPAILRLDGSRQQCRRAQAQRQRAGEGP